MKLVCTDLSGVSNHGNVISLTEAKSRQVPGGCRHLHIVVDDDLLEVECGDCGLKLNPMSVLSRFAKEESKLAREREMVRAALAELKGRVRCKCVHCGQFTPIRV